MNISDISNDSLADIFNYVGNDTYIFLSINKNWLTIYKNKYKNINTNKKYIRENLSVKYLEYAQQNNCNILVSIEDVPYYPYLKWKKHQDKIRNTNIANLAMKQNKFDCLIYAIKNKYIPTINIYYYAIENNDNVELMKIGYKNNLFKSSWTIHIVTSAIAKNSIKCLEFALANGLSSKASSLCAEAANTGNLTLLKFLHEKNCDWKVDTCEYAAANGYLECLQYAHENGCPWDKNTCEIAAENGKLDCLKYAHENGCPWNMFTILRAGSIECKEYLNQNNCTVPEDFNRNNYVSPLRGKCLIIKAC